MARVKIHDKVYVLDGNPVFQPITEYITAVRIGNPSRDDRNLANFVAFEDRRAGIGQTFGNIREDFDKSADSNGALADAFNMLIKPPEATSLTLNPGAGTSIKHAPWLEFTEDADTTDRVMVGIADKAYVINAAGTGSTAVANTPFTSTDSHLVSLVQYRAPLTGALTTFAASHNAEDLAYLTDWDAASPWSRVTGIAASMLFQFDGKLWAGGPSTLRWSIDPTNAAAWTSAVALGAWPNKWRFVGVLPFGQTYFPYVLVDYDTPAKAYLAVVDADNNQLLPVAPGIRHIHDVFVHEGSIIVIHDDGKRVTAYDPLHASKIDLEWNARKRGGFISGRPSRAITGMSTPSGVGIVADTPAGTTQQIFLYHGGGWHPYGYPGTFNGALVTPSSHYSTVHGAMFFVVADTDGSTHTCYSIPYFNEAFTPGTAQSVAITANNIVEITPWTALGFDDLRGALLDMVCGGFFDSANQVQVDYQVDLDESAWTSLGTFPNTGAPAEAEVSGRSEPIEAENRLLFDGLQGVSFKWARFRFTLITTANPGYTTPNAYPMTLHFYKRPKGRRNIRFNVDVQATINERGSDGVGLTPDSIWQELCAVYDLDTVPEVEIGPYHTWAILTSIPYFTDIETDGDDSIVPIVTSADVTIAVTLAELI